MRTPGDKRQDSFLAFCEKVSGGSWYILVVYWYTHYGSGRTVVWPIGEIGISPPSQGGDYRIVPGMGYVVHVCPIGLVWPWTLDFHSRGHRFKSGMGYVGIPVRLRVTYR